MSAMSLIDSTGAPLPMNTEKTIAQQIADYGLTSKHVPNTSKNFKDLRLDYQVTLSHKGREVITIDYHMGIGHIPGFRHTRITNLIKERWVREACATGKTPRFHPDTEATNFKGGAAILPDLEGVLYCLILDSSVIDYSTFEDWAREYGFDPDSRSAEAIYRKCLEQALTLRAKLGEAELSRLREVFQDY